MTSIVALWCYPLKSARGERLQSVVVDREGLRSDRAWACIDLEDGTVGSAKHPRRWGRLLEVAARAEGEGGAAAVVVAGCEVMAGSAKADAVLSQHLARPVRLT